MIRDAMETKEDLDASWDSLEKLDNIGEGIAVALLKILNGGLRLVVAGILCLRKDR